MYRFGVFNVVITDYIVFLLMMNLSDMHDVFLTIWLEMILFCGLVLERCKICSLQCSRKNSMEVKSRTLKTLRILLNHISVFFALCLILDLFLFLNYVYVCVSLLWAHLSAVHTQLRRGQQRCIAAGVTSDCGLHYIGIGNWTLVLCRRSACFYLLSLCFFFCFKTENMMFYI